MEAKNTFHGKPFAVTRGAGLQVSSQPYAAELMIVIHGEAAFNKPVTKIHPPHSADRV